MYASASYRRAVRRYRRYYRWHAPTPAWQKAAVGLGVVLAMGAAAGHVHHHHHAGHVPAQAPALIAYSRTAWAKAFLRDIPEPVTATNVCAVVVWETREGGGFGNQAAANPLNVNPPYGTGWPGYHAIGAWAFPSARTGLAYTVATVRNYPGILAALHDGHDAPAVWEAIMASPWAVSHYGGTLGGNC